MTSARSSTGSSAVARHRTRPRPRSCGGGKRAASSAALRGSRHHWSAVWAWSRFSSPVGESTYGHVVDHYPSRIKLGRVSPAVSARKNYTPCWCLFFSDDHLLSHSEFSDEPNFVHAVLPSAEEFFENGPPPSERKNVAPEVPAVFRTIVRPATVPNVRTRSSQN